MARTFDQIVSDAMSAPHPRGGNGVIYRRDMLEAMEGLEGEERHKRFNDLVDALTFLSTNDKLKMKSDYSTY